jgi:hypothetical protein
MSRSPAALGCTSSAGGHTAPRRNIGDSFYGPDLRTGSHCLILGEYNNYSGSGNFVAGMLNAVSSYWTSVSGGVRNSVSSSTSSVSGGSYNTARGDRSSVSSGYR